MKIGIDKTCLNNIDKLKKFKNCQIIYIFDTESLSELLRTNLYCVHISQIKQIDINLTSYTLKAIKTLKIENISEEDIPKKKDYKFCIIIPSYNNDHGNIEGKTFLQKCVESVLNQTYEDYTLVIVDDMSTDKSVETVENCVDNFEGKDRITYLIRNSYKRYNGGNRNVGIEYALKNIEFDYFVFMDSDDWLKNENVLQNINDNLWDCEMLLTGTEILFQDGTVHKKVNTFDTFEDLFLSTDKCWCTAWARVIRKDKIVYFPEGTTMEDRTWCYEQTDNIDINNVRVLEDMCYVWNRKNVTNSVCLVRDDIWKASAWKHIGQQLMLIPKLKHKEMIPILKDRIQVCINKANSGIYDQY